MIELILSLVVTAGFAGIGLMEFLARRGAEISRVPDLADSPFPIVVLLALCAAVGNALIWLPRFLAW